MEEAALLKEMQAFCELANRLPALRVDESQESLGKVAVSAGLLLQCSSCG